MLNIGLVEFIVIIFFILLFIKPKEIPGIIKHLGLFYRKLQRYIYEAKYEFSDLDIMNDDLKKDNSKKKKKLTK